MLTTSRMVGAAIFVSAAFIFILDLTPVRGAADGAAYGLIVAMAGYFGKRAVLYSALLAGALTIAGPLLGAEDDETLIQIIAGRAVGLSVIAVLAGALLHLLDTSAKAAASKQEIEAHNKVLLEIARLALSGDRPLKERFQAITELTAKALDVDRACVARVEDAGRRLKLYEVWDRRVGRHFGDLEPPPCYAAEFQELLKNDFVASAEDVAASPLHRDSIGFYEARGIRAVLHTAALYRGRVVGSLVVTRGEPHHWTDRQIAFAKSVSHIVALLFALDQSEKTLERLDLVSQGIFVLARDGTVEYANRTARELAGHLESEQPPAVPFPLSPMAGGSDHQHVSYKGRDLEVYRTQVPSDGTLVRIDDVTARNAALTHSKRMEARLEESAKLQAMGQLAAGVAHDFNNLLGAIMGFGQLLAKALADRPAQLAYADRILGVCKKGKGLVDEILAFARTSSVERDTVDLALVLGSALEALPASPAVSVIPPQEPLPVSGNAVQLTRLIENLVVNASHACEGIEGRVTVSAGRASQEELCAIVWSAKDQHEKLLGLPHPEQDYCFLRVTDNGHGIAPETLNRIFEPFFTTKGRRRGSGLGLAVVHGVTEAHGGCCHVRSEPGKGTTFTIYLPSLAQTALEQGPAIGEFETVPPASIQGKEKVLIVDDDGDFAEALMTGLEQLGYHAVAYDDPLQALAAIRRAPNDIDVLVTDHFMPKMHGLELVSAVRSTHNAIKIVLCSGGNLPSLEEAARAAGADVFLRKPFGAADVAQQIRSVIRDKFAAVA